MKPSKHLIAALGLIAGALTATAQTPVTIYIAGANADRVATNTAIPHILQGQLTYAGSNSDPTKANFVMWTGGTFNGTPVTVKASYLGATAGIASVGGNLAVRFLPDSATGGSNADPTVGSNPNDPAVPQIAMSSAFVSSSPFNGTYQGHTYEDLTPQDQILSVLGFKWVASKNFPADNITPQIAQLLWQNGKVPLAMFTGDPADEHKIVFATGRNQDSGARFVAQAESGVGINAVIKQYKPTISGAGPGAGGATVGGTVTSHALWPVETTFSGSSLFKGNSGASSGSTLAPYLTAVLGSNTYTAADPNATAGFYISYLSEQDADTVAIANGAVALKWNGVPYSRQAIQEGNYTFWGYEHLLYRAATTGIFRQFGDTLALQIKTTDAGPAGQIFIDTMKVSRQSDGGVISPTYF